MVADHHFGHSKMYKEFKRADGTPLRPFSSCTEADEYMVEQHNKVVKPGDKVYFLGDISFSKKLTAGYLSRMNGEKVIIKGNHDTESIRFYSEHFKDVRGSHQFNGMLLTHIPVHPSSLARWGFNVHGHLHATRVMDINRPTEVDNRYFCVSVEHTGYAPIAMEEVLRWKPKI